MTEPTLQNKYVVPPRTIVETADGRTFGPGALVEQTTEVVTVDDPFGMFGPPSNVPIGQVPGLTTTRINGDVVPGPLKIRQEVDDPPAREVRLVRASYNDGLVWDDTGDALTMDELDEVADRWNER